jgi:hypothetical protein
MFVLKHCFENLNGEFVKSLDAHVLKLPPGIALTLEDGDAWVLVIGKSPGRCFIYGLICCEVQLQPAGQGRERSVAEVAAS